MRAELISSLSQEQLVRELRWRDQPLLNSLTMMVRCINLIIIHIYMYACIYDLSSVSRAL